MERSGFFSIISVAFLIFGIVFFLPARLPVALMHCVVFLVFSWGLVAAFQAHFSKNERKKALGVFWEGPPPVKGLAALAEEILSVAQVTRKEGLVALDHQASKIKNPFLKSWIPYLIDGVSREGLEQSIDSEIQKRIHREGRIGEVLEELGGFAPVMGVIATLVGLIATLGSAVELAGSPDLKAQLFHGVAASLMGLIYGYGFSLLLFQPAALRFQRSCEQLAVKLGLVRIGVLGIQAGLSLDLLRDRLEAHAEKRIKK